MTLRLSETAAGHIESIYRYIALDNEDAALETIEGLLTAMQQLLTFPLLGRSGGFGNRKLIHGVDVIVYRVLADVINIEAVFHGSRRY